MAFQPLACMPANNEGKFPGLMGNPGMPMTPLIAKFCKLKPRGVPEADWPLVGGKWPFEFASVREGAMCAGSET